MSVRSFIASLIRRSALLTVMVMLLIAGTLFGLVVQACGGPPPTIVLPADATPQQRIAAGEEAWQMAGINDYRITVTDTLFGIGVITHVVVVTVKDGVVVNQQMIQCTIENTTCAAGTQLDASADYSVPGLFAFARANAANPQIALTLAIDPTYGFPQTTQTALRNANDAAASRVVTQFEPLA